MSDNIRRHFTPEQKAAILKEHLVEKTPISQVCDRHHIGVNLFYLWQRELFENAHLAFGKNGRRDRQGEDAKERRIQALESKLQRKNEVMAELMEALTDEKKRNGDL
jgi:transposase